jgi:hypothetical protein
MSPKSLEIRSNIIVRGIGVDAFGKACIGKRASYYENGIQWTGEPEVEFTFNALVPVPEEILREGFYEKGISWQTQNWGTFMDSEYITTPYLITDEDSEDMFDFIVETFHSPPLKWLESASLSFPVLKFEILYAGESEAFHKRPITRMVYQNGEIIAHEVISSDREVYDIFLHKLFFDFVSI